MLATDENYKHFRAIVKSLVIHHGFISDRARKNPSMALLVTAFCLRLAVDALNCYISE